MLRRKGKPQTPSPSSSGCQTVPPGRRAPTRTVKSLPGRARRSSRGGRRCRSGPQRTRTGFRPRPCPSARMLGGQRHSPTTPAPGSPAPAPSGGAGVPPSPALSREAQARCPPRQQLPAHQAPAAAAAPPGPALCPPRPPPPAGEWRAGPRVGRGQRPPRPVPPRSAPRARRGHGPGGSGGPCASPLRTKRSARARHGERGSPPPQQLSTPAPAALPQTGSVLGTSRRAAAPGARRQPRTQQPRTDPAARHQP